VVYTSSATNITNLGYNVVDVALGIGNTASGFAAASNGTDIGNVSVLPVSPLSFKPLHNSPAAGIIITLPEGYPAKDFYGVAISNGAAAGAVQQSAGEGYYLEVTVNNSDGRFTITPPLDPDGVVSGNVTITPSSTNTNCSIDYWLVGGERDNSTSLSLNITAHTFVQAIFKRIVPITVFTDNTPLGEGEPGNLRAAINDQQDGDVISFGTTGNPVVPGTTTVSLGGRLPDITKSITIQGNGVTIGRDPAGTNWPQNYSSLLRINDSTAVVTISRVHFKDGRAAAGGAIRNTGTMNLESCIFSNNVYSYADSNSGGAISTGGTVTIKGCTFYGNTMITTNGQGGAIASSGTMTLEGNLFYGNTANGANPVVYQSSGTITSLGYNVVDKALGATSTVTSPTSGFDAAANNTDVGNLSAIPVSTVSFRLLSNSGAPAGVITTLPTGYPAKDFYGETISAPAAAGAVQGMSSGHLIITSVNDSELGGINISSPANTDGRYSGNVTLTAAPTSVGTFTNWLVNEQSNSTNPLTLNISADTTVHAVFSPSPSAREVTIAMWDSAGGSWDGNGAIRINVNGTDRATNAKKTGSGTGPVYYTFYVVPNNVVILYWISGSFQGENAFAVYYTDDPPNPAFTPANGTAVDTSGKLLVYKQYSTMNSIANGAQLGTFTVP
jgi:hypothetical protein